MRSCKAKSPTWLLLVTSARSTPYDPYMPMYLATASQEMYQIRTMLATGDIRGKRVTGFFNDWLRFSYLKATKCGIHLDKED